VSIRRQRLQALARPIVAENKWQRFEFYRHKRPPQLSLIPPLLRLEHMTTDDHYSDHIAEQGKLIHMLIYLRSINSTLSAFLWSLRRFLSLPVDPMSSADLFCA
jgi:hypothetical protein